MEQIFQESARIAGFVAQAAWGILPVFLLSVTLGVLVRMLELDGAIRAAFDARIGYAVLLATAVGAFSPFCSCTVVPLVAGLLVAGVPLAPVMAFWVASPTMAPEVFALSVGMLGWPLAVARLLATFALSLGAGYLTLALVRGGLLGGKVLRRGVLERYGEDGKAGVGEECCEASASREPTLVVVGSKPVPVAETTTDGGDAAGARSCGTAGCEPEVDRQGYASWWGRIVDSIRRLDRPRFAKEVLLQSWSLGRWLLLAFAIEALILFHVPQETIAGVLGGGSALAVPIAALVGLPLYMNEMGALPIVSGLLESGMQPGAAITFLIAGPVTTVPAMAAVWGVVRPRVFALYVGVGLVGAVVLGLATNLLL
jgi:uncharacterized membrane protein YraQ (UPF0718 family)